MNIQILLRTILYYIFKMRNKVSVIIPCYNYSEYIELCLLSVLCQRCNYDIEIIVGDDCSTDNSINIINRIKDIYENIPGFEIKVLSHPVNIGEVMNTKSLLEKCTGEYIAYLDADDYWVDPFKLNKQIDFMNNNLDHSLCVAGFLHFEDGRYIPDDKYNNWLCPVGELSSENLCDGNVVTSSSSRLFRKYDDLLSDDFYNFPYSDWLLNFELSLKGKIGYLNFPSYVYRIHSKSLSKRTYQFEIDNYSNSLKRRLDDYKIKNKK